MWHLPSNGRKAVRHPPGYEGAAFHDVGLEEHSRCLVAKRGPRLYDRGPDLGTAPVEQLPPVATPPGIGPTIG